MVPGSSPGRGAINMPKDIRTYKQRAKYLKEAVRKRRKELRIKAIEFLGGRCSICGYSKCSNALEIHHKDPNLKEFGLSSRGLTRSWEKIELELRKCTLLCANCHREIHSKINIVELT